jgi:hypothetical protein
MPTREQVYTMFILRNREDNLFSVLPDELIYNISDFGQDPNSEINIALRLAASGLEKDIATLVEMVKANPRLLLQAGNVVNRGGFDARRKTLYEFFLGEGDPASAKRIEFGFAEIPNGENERIRQYERYKPHIEKLAKQIELKKPAFDLKPLIDIIKKSSPADITAALNKDMKHESVLRDMLIAFRNAVRPKREIVGMHYKHYTTLQQALDLLYDEWKELSSNYTNFGKCRLVWRQIIGYLQRSLPAVDRCAFARAFDDEERTLNFKYEDGTFPDVTNIDEELDFVGVGFDEAIFGWRREGARSSGGWRRALWKTHVEQKLQTCRTYAATPTASDRLCNLLK